MTRKMPWVCKVQSSEVRGPSCMPAYGQNSIFRSVPGMTPPRLPSVTTRPFRTRFRAFDSVGVGNDTFKALGMTSSFVGGPWAILHAGI